MATGGFRGYYEYNEAFRHVRCRASGTTGAGNLYRIEAKESGTVFSQHLDGDTGPNIYYLPPIKDYGGGMVFHFLFGGNYTSVQLYTALDPNKPNSEKEFFWTGDLHRRINISHSSGPQTNRRLSFLSLDDGGWLRIADEATSGIGYAQTDGQSVDWYALSGDSMGAGRTIPPETFTAPGYANHSKVFYTKANEAQEIIYVGTDYQLAAHQTGSIVRMETGVGSTVTVTLPPAECGLHFWFVSADPSILAVQPSSGDYIRQWSSTVGRELGTETSRNFPYNHMQLVAMDDTNWYVTHQIPEWSLNSWD